MVADPVRVAHSVLVVDLCLLVAYGLALRIQVLVQHPTKTFEILGLLLTDVTSLWIMVDLNFNQGK